MAYNYPPSGPGQGYPPQQPGYPPAGQQGYPGAYPPTQGGYPPGAAAPGGYPAPGAPQGAYPPQPSAGGYPQAPGGYSQPGGIGFEGLANQPPGPPQHPAQNYAPTGGYSAPPSGPSMPPMGGYGPPGSYPPQQGYGAPQQAAVPPLGYNAPPQGQGYPTGAPMPTQGQLYGHPPAQQAYQAPLHSKPDKATQKVTAGMAAMKIATHGTVVPHPGFNAEADAQVLRKAMKGLGTDEKAIIGVIGARTNEQRQQIKTTYKQAYGRDLVKDLKSELSGKFEDLAVALFMKPREYDAYCLRDAMAGAGTTESTLIEILVSRSNEDIKEINEIYKKLYGAKLEKALMSETSGHFRKLLVSLNNASRDQSLHVDASKARDDAQRLYSAGEKKWGTDEATFNLVMASRSFPQLRATFEAYQQIANRDIVRSIKGEFSGDIEDGMVAVVEVCRNAPSYFARRLHESMKGAGTNDKMLIRVVVSRCEIDMVEIKQQFLAMYKKPLPGYIKDDTSGDYKHLILSLVGH